MAALFTAHARALAAAYSDLENQAMAQEQAAPGTPGTLLERTNAGGFRYYALQRYEHDGTRRETYIAGPVGDPKADELADRTRQRISEHREVRESIRLLIREGYAALEPKHYAVVAALGNHGLFAAGGVLVGTHAFEVIVNRLGVRASAFATMDIDIARASHLVLNEVPAGGLLDILRSSGVEFQEVPGFDPRDPPIKFKEKGRSRFTVDLIVASGDMEYSIQYVPELKAHAVALPYFRYLISETQPGAAISRMGCIAVRVPLPERFAIHKLLVAQLRVGRSEKAQKDIRQAAVLMAALGELHPGAIEEAFAKTPTSARTRILKSMTEAARLLSDHPRAMAEVEAILAKRSRKPVTARK